MKRLYLLLILISHSALSDIRTKDLSDSSPMIVFVADRNDLIVVQWKTLNTEYLKVELENSDGKVIQHTSLFPGNTIAFFETQMLYAGEYTVKVTNGIESITQKISLVK